MSRLWRAALWTGVAFGIPAAFNLAIARQRRELLSALPGDGGEYAWPLGRIFYQVRGEGQPLVLVHGIGAGESSYEWRHNFEALAEHFKVYALDLPGFGKSSRRDIGYTADLYVAALVDFLRDVVQQPAYIVASSLSGAYAVKLAFLRPELVSKLVLICPTGLNQLCSRLPLWSQLAYGTFSLPAIGKSIYNGIASYGYIEAYMRENLYVDPTRVTPALVEHYYQSAHQAGGQYALRSFIAGLLNCDIRAVYPQIKQPILVTWGLHARVSPAENAQPFLTQNPHARLRVFNDSGALPHDEEAADFNDVVVTFLTRDETERLLEVPLTEAIQSV
jgi:pimeloyl-ACP methyl ester carboxylesterase